VAGMMIDITMPLTLTGTGICLLMKCFVLEYLYWLNILYWNIP
jgi:hypothetical protein